MPTLKISISADSTIRIEPESDVSDFIWEEVIGWWSLGRRIDGSSKFIDIGITEFAQRKLWLRENWTSLGYSLIIHDTVKVALKRVDGLMGQFIELSDREEVGIDQVNLDLIQLKKPLTDFQKKNLRSLISMPNGANFSVPGAGKTLTTLALWEYFRTNELIERMLIVCPRSAFEAWESDSHMLLRHITDCP